MNALTGNYRGRSQARDLIVSGPKVLSWPMAGGGHRMWCGPCGTDGYAADEQCKLRFAVRHEKCEDPPGVTRLEATT